MKNTVRQRNTRQRRVVLDELQKLTSHPTAANLYELVRCRLPRISLGTVYRNLELLARLGVIQKLDFVGGEARYDGNVAQHDHVRCVQCGRVDDVSACSLDMLSDETKDWRGYRILGHRLEFFGICPECNAVDNQGGPYGGGGPTDEPTQRGAGFSVAPCNNSSTILNCDSAYVSRKPR